MPQKKPYSARKKVLLDAGPVIGLFNEQDDWHARCVGFFGEVNYDYVTTEAVISEVIYKIQQEKHLAKAVAAVICLLDDVAKKVYTLHFLKLEDFARIKQLRQTYSDQKRLDFADMSLVIAAEQTKIAEIVTIDKNDFEKLRWKNGKQDCSFTVIQPDIAAFEKRLRTEK